MAKSKKERRSSIRHMAADDAFSVLEALDRVAKEAEPTSGDAGQDDTDDEESSERD